MYQTLNPTVIYSHILCIFVHLPTGFDFFKHKDNAELQLAVPGSTRAQGTQCPKWIFIIPIVLVGKTTLDWYIACHAYINNHQTPFIGPIKIYLIFWHITFPWIMEVLKWKLTPLTVKKMNFQKMLKVSNCLWYKVLSTQISHS